jgi:hypothetical protein
LTNLASFAFMPANNTKVQFEINQQEAAPGTSVEHLEHSSSNPSPQSLRFASFAKSQLPDVHHI